METIRQMLKENTGRHPLDSGFGNGRHWQKNQDRDFESQQAVNYELYEYHDGTLELNRTVSVYHFLKELEVDEICEHFNELNSEDWDSELYGVSTEAFDYLQNNFELEINRTFNTYNCDSDLDQVLQGTWIRLNDEQYLVLQVHNGADVRGGYTDAKLFKPNEDGLINEYISEYMTQDEIIEYELEYIDEVIFKDETIKLTDEIKDRLYKQVCG